MLFFLVLVCLSMLVNAGVGDYQGISLKEDKQTVEAKLKKLEDAGTVRKTGTDEFSSTFIGKSVICRFSYHQGVLYAMEFVFEKTSLKSYDGELKTFVYEKAMTELTKMFGAPAEDYGYPEQLYDNEGILVAEWESEGKRAVLSIVRVGDGCHVEIELYDDTLKNKAEEAQWLSLTGE